MTEHKPTTAFVCGKVYILCADERFAAAMAHEMCRMGLATVTVTPPWVHLVDPSEEVSLVVADGDDLTDDEWMRRRAQITCPWIFWSRRDLSFLETKCTDTVCLRRPFDLEDFSRAVMDCLATGGEPVTRPSAMLYEKKDVIRVVKDGVLFVKNEEVILTPFEWAVYQCLRHHRGETVSRDTLRAILDGAGGNTVDVYVCRLRAKLEKPLGVRMITTVRGEGYRME